jgi:hypothetical protein
MTRRAGRALGLWIARELMTSWRGAREGLPQGVGRASVRPRIDGAWVPTPRHQIGVCSSLDVHGVSLGIHRGTFAW